MKNLFANILLPENWEYHIEGGSVISGVSYIKFDICGVYSITLPLWVSVDSETISSINTKHISIENSNTGYKWTGYHITINNGSIWAENLKLPKKITYIFNKLLFNCLIYSVYGSKAYTSYYCEKSNKLHLFGQYSFINTCKDIMLYNGRTHNFLKFYFDGSEFTSWDDGSCYIYKDGHHIIKLDKEDSLQYYSNINMYIQRNFDSIVIKDF